ncbi:MAG: ABC transporter substrate-binding protein [Candidatus Izemoplasmatales bacterium]
MRRLFKFMLFILAALTLVGCDGLDIPSGLTTDELTIEPTTLAGQETTIEEITTIEEQTNVPTTIDLPTEIPTSIEVPTEIPTEVPTTEEVTSGEETSEDDLVKQLTYIYNLAVEAQAFTGTYEEWLETVRGPEGLPGQDGREIVIRVDNFVLQWQYLGETTWVNLLDLKLLVPDVNYVVGTDINDLGELIIKYSDDSEVNLGPILTIYSVVFKDYNNYIIDIQLVMAGHSAIRPETPHRIGYDFTGWSEDFSYISANTIIYATYMIHQFQVDFVADEEIPSVYVDYGQMIELPIPNKFAYEFIGWFTGEGVSDRQFYNDDLVYKDMTLYARFIPKVYEVTLLDYNGQVIDVVRFTIEDTLVFPTLPNEGDMVFIEWNIDFEALEENPNPTLKATYSQAYNLSIYGNGVYYDQISLVEGDLLDLSGYEKGSLYGYPNFTFMDWYMDDTYTTPLNLTHMPAYDLLIYGYFNQAPKLLQDTFNTSLLLNSNFDPMAYVTATDYEDGDISPSITYSGSVDMTIEGTYTINYYVEDSHGLSDSLSIDFTVSNLVTTYANGFYDFSQSNQSLRLDFMAAAEQWLMNTMTGGIPLFANANPIIYSSRVNLASQIYSPLMQYGDLYASLTSDDSTLLMYDGNYGQVGDYTFRTYLARDPQSFNPMYTREMADDNQLRTYYIDSLYEYEYDSLGQALHLNPSLADGDPLAINPQTNIYGKVLSDVWQVPIKSNLIWTYHPQTDISGLPVDHQIINAYDFVDTFNLGIQEGWSGSYYLVDSEYGLISMTVIDPLTIEIDFSKEISAWDVKYLLNISDFTPINVDLFNLLGSAYGSSPDSVAYCGPYMIDDYVTGAAIHMVKNPNFHSPNKYHYTGYQVMIIPDPNDVFNAFVNGYLDKVNVPTTEIVNYRNDPHFYQSPTGSTFTLNINGTGDLASQQNLFPGSSWVPEPILGQVDFKLAMYHVLDRQALVDQSVLKGLPGYYPFSPAYYVNPEDGITYRYTSQGLSVGTNLMPFYNPGLASVLFDQALASLINQGVYTPGTSSQWNIIELDLYVMNTNQYNFDLGDFIKNAFESNFVSNTYFIKIQVNVQGIAFPDIYYSHMFTGDFDLAIGGIQGNLLDAPSFLGVFSSDNRLGFQLNWGIDTAIPEILVEYTDHLGTLRREYWSFDAIESALNGEVEVINGVEVDMIDIQLWDMSTRSLYFHIGGFTNPKYEYFTYTLQMFNDDSSSYEDVLGHVGIDLLNENLLIDQLKPSFNGLDASGQYLSLGDYQLIIRGYYNNGNDYDEVIESNLMTYSIVENYQVHENIDELQFEVYYRENYDSNLQNVRVFSVDNGYTEIYPNIDYSNPSWILINGLTPDASYYVFLEFSDGNIDGLYGYLSSANSNLINIDLWDTSTTSLSFNIDGFTNPKYEYLTYTLQMFNLDISSYEDVLGYVGIDLLSETLIIDQLKPSFNSLDASGQEISLGDYQLIVRGYFNNGNEFDEVIKSSLFTYSILEYYQVHEYIDELQFEVYYRDNYSSSLQSVKVFSVDNGFVEIYPNINYTDPSWISIGGLTQDATYYVLLEFTDGNIDGMYGYLSVFNSNLVPNGDFTQLNNNWHFDQREIENAAGYYEVINEEMLVTITKPSQGETGPILFSDSIWMIQGAAYEITFTAKADTPRTIRIALGYIDMLDIILYSPELFYFDLSDQYQTFSFTYNMNVSDRALSILFFQGTINGDEGANVIYYDDVQMIPVPRTPDIDPPVIYGLQDYIIELGSYFNPLDHIYAYDSHEGWINSSNILITNNVDINTPGLYDVIYYVEDSMGNYIEETIQVEVLEFFFAPTTKIIDGDFTNTTTIIPFVQDTPENGNADITGPGIWYYYEGTWDNAYATFSVNNGEAQIDVTSSGTFAWSIMLMQNGIELVQGQTYQLSFDAYALVPRDIRVSMTDMYAEDFMIDTVKTSYSYSFTYYEPTDLIRLQFWLAYTDNYANTTIFIDNVVLSELTTSGN